MHLVSMDPPGPYPKLDLITICVSADMEERGLGSKCFADVVSGSQVQLKRRKRERETFFTPKNRNDMSVSQ